jgi:hypothetical protein
MRIALCKRDFNNNTLIPPVEPGGNKTCLDKTLKVVKPTHPFMSYIEVGIFIYESLAF